VIENQWEPRGGLWHFRGSQQGRAPPDALRGGCFHETASAGAGLESWRMEYPGNTPAPGSIAHATENTEGFTEKRSRCVVTGEAANRPAWPKKNRLYSTFNVCAAFPRDAWESFGRSFRLNLTIC
jgi:hypothetical protein